MKFRVISDLHVDVNEETPLYLHDFEKGMFTLICGDISGDPITDAYWLKKNCNYRGAFISGNHIVYNERCKPIQDLQNELKILYPNEKDKRMVYLEKDKIVLEDEKVVIIGATLWTNYEIGHADKRFNMGLAKRFMNDFRFGRIRANDGEIISLDPEWCAEEFDKTVAYIDSVCKEYKDYSVIVMTHHCPSTKSISFNFSRHSCNGAYCSNLEDFIKEHKNIVAWCCGHVHHRHTYDVGQCKVIANPRGYCHYGEAARWNENEFTFEIENGKCHLTRNIKQEVEDAFEKHELDNNF